MTPAIPSALAHWLIANGVNLPTNAELIEGAIASGLAILALGTGWLAGRRLGPKLASLWQQRVGNHVEGLGHRMHTIVRHGVAALLLAILANAVPWGGFAALLLGIALGAATAALTLAFLRGLHTPRWVAWLTATIVFIAILSHAIGGFDVITTTLDRIGVDFGRRRLSLLALATLVVTVVALYAGVRLANRILGHSIAQARGLDATQKLLFQKIASIVVVVVAFFFGIDLLGIDLTSFAIFSGAFGLAIGFGLQKTIGNLIAGIILLMDRSIKPGDVIVVGDSFGWVNKIGVRAVSVITRDGKEHLIPNEILMTQEVENWSFSDRNVRVRISVGVAYETDLKLAQELMLKAATDSPRVLTSPPPNVWLTSFGDYAVEHEILAWISDPEGGVGNVKSDVLNRLWVLFKENGIDIPVPRREIMVKSWPADGTPTVQLPPAAPK
ncbi:mechanosensitive ion channel protein MscS [Sphingomonas koreensis]|jgi:small-conductance mechanosensitive channel|uniref:Mechanosensitive ion channel protein MscS n=1 Tax=Sphingomonas koreensis TaxID=93064 RepID=A0A1L6J904_9SPHN|nr:mechanosensitive ion channel domain-containing protein [Sphingomonas koreensis]APR52412.1 mechanosensitive ion channel protein MscS [Sphingomonas koreensis]MDC7811570.1 mechanosensitive ion channel [Sphingomonas koreensis]RSU19700.1 mechanosensitive ion channel protein MscS [Sphingomonas koreensis]RSU26488.1 mechanosensitive ion channel protein MscS [Sphingomonas koreensis]RSU27270.1 mechanosensitive ion channel protein MscS [Sphingomonas koreensis]